MELLGAPLLSKLLTTVSPSDKFKNTRGARTGQPYDTHAFMFSHARNLGVRVQ